ncbi:MAG: phosphonate C-P lyase system protein PhnH, partial [Clostridia bacterium]|nr:phosphonate C-P lyase system protein PhnH [Clostridia bacterium]
SATIVAEVNQITNERELILQGPGIEDKNELKVDLNGHWVEKRRLKNIEYPLGVDMIMVDKNSNLVGIPRTTQILR